MSLKSALEPCKTNLLIDLVSWREVLKPALVKATEFPAKMVAQKCEFCEDQLFSRIFDPFI